MKKILIMGLMVVLGGCATAEEKEAEKLAKMRERIAEAQVWCAEIGILPDSAGWQGCYMTRYQDEQARRRRNAQRMGAAFAKGMQDYSNTMTRQTEAYLNRPMP